MNLADLFALPSDPSFHLQLGPDFEKDSVIIHIGLWDLHKSKFREWVCSLPEIQEKQAVSYRVLAQHTQGNRLLARVLIALGDLEGLWQFYPDRSIPSLWSKSNMYPMILSGSFNLPQAVDAPSSRVPKPSEGDLEPTEGFCEACEQPMGPEHSRSHDRSRWNGTDVCNVCVNEGVDPYDVRNTKQLVKKAEYGKDPLANVEPIMPRYEGMTSFLDSFK